MSYERLAYHDQDSAQEMHDDCAACASRIGVRRAQVDNQAVTMPAPSLAYESFPQEVRKPEIEVSAAAAHLASRLHLHLN